MNNLISIVIPVYNVEKYLDRCLSSVTKQTYNNIEIILVDDGSKDNSGNLCEEWKKKDNRIVVAHKDNGGLSDARNYGIKIATGEYISFIDSDDFVDYRFIEILYDEIEKTGSLIAAVGLREYFEGDETDEDEYHPECTEIFNRENAIRCILRVEKLYDYAWNKLYKRELFDDVEYPFGRKMEDLGTTYKLFNKVSGVAYNPCRLYYYFQRDDSILHVAGRNFYEDKYVLATERYNALDSDTDLYLDNAHFLFRAIIDCYPHLNENDQREAKKKLKYLWKTCRSICSKKNKIKYYMILYTEKLYIRKYRHD